MALILLIEDDRDLAEALVDMLRMQGHEVVSIEDGSHWQQTLADHPVNLVMTDMFMPNKDGIETIREIRESGYEIPILAISGGSTRHDFDAIEYAKDFGATDVLRKPIAFEALESKVQELLSEAKP